MNVSDIASLVQTIGVSGVMLFAACFFVKYMFDKFMQELASERAEHSKEMGDVTNAVNNNTIVITQLVEYLKKEDEK